MKKAIRATAFVFLVAACILFTVISITALSLPDSFSMIKGTQMNLNGSDNLTFSPGENMKTTGEVSTADNELYLSKINLFNIFPVKTVQVKLVENTYVIPCGTPFGVKMFTSGVVVVGMGSITTDKGESNPGKSAGICIGDVITNINGIEVTANEQVSELIAGSNGQPIRITIRRKNMNFTVQLSPAKAKSDGVYRAGLWVRDSSAGIGTMTFYDPEKKIFGGLGHAICDVDTGEILPLMSGEVVDVKITGVIKGEAGTAGELKGVFSSDKTRGILLMNTATGVFGRMKEAPLEQKAVQVALKQEIREGPVKIRTTVSGDTPQEFDAVIEKINLSESALTKNLVIRITDETLLSRTGGIVQGMSGSPILQDGKFVGAVTHVFINDPTRGYGILAENMLKTSVEIADSTLLEAS